MDAKTNLKAKLPGRHVTKGPERAPHAIGLALPCSTARVPYEICDASCMTAGEKFVERGESGLRPRDIVTRKAFECAAAVVTASRGSTNVALHLPAFAYECGLKFDLFYGAEVFKKTPYIADLKPRGRYLAKDMFDAEAVPLLMKTLRDHGFLHGECITVTEHTVAENLRRVLAPEGAIVKVAVMSDLNFAGTARCFDGEEARLEAVKRKKYTARAETWKARKPGSTSGYLWKCALQVGAAREGAVTHPGGAVEKSCYADI